MNYRQIKAIEKANKERILKVCPDCPDTSGIYFLLRKEGGFKYAYIGQAKHLLTRLAEHLNGYQHIDLSIKKHGLYSADNPCGWEVNYLRLPENELDAKEQQFIMRYANAGWQMRNKTSGGQGEGKRGIADNKPSKTYYDGLAQGYKNAQRFVANLFDKHLVYAPKPKDGKFPTENQIKAMQKFSDFLTMDDGE